MFSCKVVSKFLWPHGLQQSWLPRSSLSPRDCSNICPLNRWYNPNISCSVIPFSSCPQSFPASRSFLMSQLFASGGQSIGASDSASVLPMNIQGWFLLELISFPLVWSPCCPRDSQESSPVPEFKSINSLALSLYGPTLIPIYDYWKTTVLPRQGFVSKGMFLLFNISV